MDYITSLWICTNNNIQKCVYPDKYKICLPTSLFKHMMFKIQGIFDKMLHFSKPYEVHVYIP